jgi:hypothetical protein
LRSWPATSRATFGLASKFAPTVPIGMRRSLISSPFASVHASIALERLDRGHGLDLLGERLDARRAQAQAVERPLVEPSRGRLAVGLVGGEDGRTALAHERGGLSERGGDGLVGQRGRGAVGLDRLLLDLLADLHRLILTQSS